MNIVQTYYSYSTDTLPIRDTAGFISADMNWKSMALSCLLLKKHYGKVTLYCNRKAHDLIINKFKIPYDKVVEIPDFMTTYNGCNLWALPKIYTYSLQTEPFIHVDCDWFMFEKLSETIMNSDIIGQNIEYDDQQFNRRTLTKLISNDCYVYPWVMDEYNKEPVLRVINAGILGGNDIEFIQNYVRTIKDFISRNLPVLQRVNDGFVNSIYEQFFFYLLAKKENKSIGLCTEGDKLSTRFDWFPLDFSPAPKTGYMHLLANLKRRMISYVFISNYLDYIDTELNYRISKYCYDNKIAPLINYPHWDMYSLDKSNQRWDSNKLKKTGIEMVHTSQDAEQAIQQMERKLPLFHKQLYNAQKRNVIPLWEIPSLWDMNYSFDIWQNISFSKISYDEACAFLSNTHDTVNRMLAEDEKIYLILIPDSSMLRVHKCMVTGVKADIIEYISAKGNSTLYEIGLHLSTLHGVSFETEEARTGIDRIIRSMMVGNILKLNIK
jgi:hypothetical protein